MLPNLKILFLCTGNSCRSQMAEGWARHLLGNRVAAHSAGIAPHGLDPRAIRVMAERGVDISDHTSKSVEDLLDAGFDYVVTVCDSARGSCPLFPGKAVVVHQSFADPPTLAADAITEEDALSHYRKVRDEIRDYVQNLPKHLPDPAVIEDRLQEPGTKERNS